MTPPRFTVVQKAAAPSPHSDCASILVAEDDPVLRREIVDLLGDYEVIEACDGQEALSLALHHQPDLLLLDWMMPERSGLEVARQLRGEASMRLTPITLLTGRNDEASMKEALEAGVNDFVNKPLSPHELQHRVERMLATWRAQQEIEIVRQLLAKSEKLSSLGELSAGIMHEINNPLNYAVSGVHALKKMAQSFEGDLRTEFEEVVGDIGEGLTRVNEIEI